MAENVTVPGVGSVPKREAMIGAAVVVTLIVVYYVRKNKAAAAPATAAASATTTDQYPPDGTTGNPQDPYSTDPATGATYGDEATGSGGTYGSYGYNSYSSNGIIGYDSSGNPVYAPGYQPTGTSSSSGGPPFSSNSAWSQYAIQTMTASNTSLDVGALTDALGLYLEGQPVDTSQQQLIFDAIAIAGDPPVAGPNGYPPKVQLNGNKGGGGGNPFNPQSVIGQTLAQANTTLAQNGISVQFVVVAGQSAPLPGAAATVPYDNSPVIAVSMTSPAQAELTVDGSGVTPAKAAPLPPAAPAAPAAPKPSVPVSSPAKAV